MGSVEAIERYLAAQLTGAAAVTPEDKWPRVHPFVTISRQAGAGGHRVAEALLEVFDVQSDERLFAGWQVFDRELCELVARDPAFSASLDSLLVEEYRTSIDDFFHQVLRSSVDQDYLMARVFQIVHAIASVGKAIIIGRGGSEVTRAMGPGVRIRIVAPEEDRIHRLAELHGWEERKARAEAKRLDSSRARLMKTHFRVDIEDPTAYDAVWNTGSAPAGDIAEAVTAVLRNRAAVWHTV